MEQVLLPGQFNTLKIQTESRECFLALLTFCTDFISECSPHFWKVHLLQFISTVPKVIQYCAVLQHEFAIGW